MSFFGDDPDSTTATAERPSMTAAERYERKRLKAGARQRKDSAASRELFPLPEVKDPDRKARALSDLAFFLKTYFPARFKLEWGSAHLQAIADFERVIRHGGMKALAMPRGSGKTAITECAAIWAILAGYRRFLMIVGATAQKAKKTLRNITNQFKKRGPLADDFPEVCVPVLALKGVNQRKPLFQGEPVQQTWTKECIVLPNIPGSAAASAIIQIAGLTGAIRGENFDRPDGELARPDLVVIDDPQTDESAKSVTQCQDRLEMIDGAIHGLVGPDEAMATIALITVIRKGDVADTLLDPEESPEWQGQRTKMIEAMPTNMKLWDQWGQVREDGLRKRDGGKAGDEFYLKHRDEMDAGAVLSWPARKGKDLSALLHAMTLRLKNDRKFAAEYQNEPINDKAVDTDLATAEQIRNKLNRVARGVVPSWVETLTAHIDVQMNALYWLVAGWSNGFNGAVIDYGVFPEQQSEYFAYSDVQHTLATAFDEPMGLEGRIFAGLGKVVSLIGGREWPGEVKGSVHRLRRILIDEGWQKATVYRFCRQSPHAAILMPSKGKGVTSTMKPIDEWTIRDGDRRAQNCIVYAADTKSPARHVLFDSNVWKSFTQHRLATAAGDRGSMTLFGDNDRTHRMLADHLTSEIRKDPEWKGRKVWQWEKLPGRDNHFLDNLVGAAVAASIEGVSVVPREEQLKSKPKRRASVWYPDHQE